MAIKDMFWRAVRKSVSSDPRASPADSRAGSTTTDSSNSSAASRPAKTPSRRPKPKKEKTARAAPLHPSERPLTETNLRHQELLSTFTMSFGRRRSSSAAGRSSFSGISPGASRQCSLDGSREGFVGGAPPGSRLTVPLALDPCVSPVAEEDRQLG